MTEAAVIMTIAVLCVAAGMLAIDYYQKHTPNKH